MWLSARKRWSGCSGTGRSGTEACKPTLVIIETNFSERQTWDQIFPFQICPNCTVISALQLVTHVFDHSNMLKVFCSCGTFWLSKTICEFSLTSQAEGNFSCDSNIVATEQNGFHLAQQTRKLNQNFQFSKHFVLAPTSFSTLPGLHEEPVTFPLDPAVHYHRCFIRHYTVTALTNSFLLICMLTTGCRHGVLHPRSAASCRLLLIALIYFWHQPSQMMNESPSQQSEKGTCASLTSVSWKIRLTANGITLKTIIVISGCFLYWINNI